MEALFQIVVWTLPVALIGPLAFVGLRLAAEIELASERDAKRYNESVRYFANALNALAIGAIAATLIIPLVNERDLGGSALIWFAMGFGLHMAGHLVLGLLRKEYGYAMG